MIRLVSELLFPRKCLFCRCLLSKEETDLCHSCREKAPEFIKSKRRIPFIAHWTAIWYYKGGVRICIHRYKFGNARGYVDTFARHLAVKLLETELCSDVDLVTWVPTSPLRKLSRGYDQSQLLAQALGKELGIPVARTLRRVRHSTPQSRIQGAAQRRANIFGAYKPCKPERFGDKRILLIDDIVTTGATASECAKVLQISGAKEIILAAIAAASHDKNK